MESAAYRLDLHVQWLAKK